jgi:hypothetical protein
MTTISLVVGLLALIYYPIIAPALEQRKHLHIASSKQAVYIGDKDEPACIINAYPERTINEMAQDFGACLEVHKEYRTKAGY